MWQAPDLKGLEDQHKLDFPNLHILSLCWKSLSTLLHQHYARIKSSLYLSHSTKQNMFATLQPHFNSSHEIWLKRTFKILKPAISPLNQLHLNYFTSLGLLLRIWSFKLRRRPMLLMEPAICKVDSRKGRSVYFSCAANLAETSVFPYRTVNYIFTYQFSLCFCNFSIILF